MIESRWNGQEYVNTTMRLHDSIYDSIMSQVKISKNNFFIYYVFYLLVDLFLLLVEQNYLSNAILSLRMPFRALKFINFLLFWHLPSERVLSDHHFDSYWLISSLLHTRLIESFLINLSYFLIPFLVSLKELFIIFVSSNYLDFKMRNDQWLNMLE